MLPPARAGLTERVRCALELFPADLLFVHRDADREPTATRRDEIRKAVEIATPNQATVPVVPVRMTEAWLLIDEPAIRSAAGNPRGTMALDLPKLGAIEGIADPKNILCVALRTACALRGRRLARFDATKAVGLVAERITDFRPLQRLSAFKEFEDLLHSALDTLAD